MLFSIIVSAMVIIHISFHTVYTCTLSSSYMQPEKHLATSKQAGNEGYLKLQIYTCQLEEERSKLTQHNFFCTHGLPYRSSNSIVMRVHNNNIAHATPTRDVTQPFLAWRIEVRLTFMDF